MWIRSKQKKWKCEVNWNAKKKKMKSEVKKRKKKSESKESSKVMKSNPWQVVTLKKVSLSLCYSFLCEPRTKAFIISQVKVLYDQLKLFVWTTLGLIPFGYIGNLVRCSHITLCQLCNSCIENLNQQDFLRINCSTYSFLIICFFLIKVKEPIRLKTRKGSLGKG